MQTVLQYRILTKTNQKQQYKRTNTYSWHSLLVVQLVIVEVLMVLKRTVLLLLKLSNPVFKHVHHGYVWPTGCPWA